MDKDYNPQNSEGKKRRARNVVVETTKQFATRRREEMETAAFDSADKVYGQKMASRHSQMMQALSNRPPMKQPKKKQR